MEWNRENGKRSESSKPMSREMNNFPVEWKMPAIKCGKTKLKWNWTIIGILLALYSRPFTQCKLPVIYFDGKLLITDRIGSKSRVASVSVKNLLPFLFSSASE